MPVTMPHELPPRNSQVRRLSALPAQQYMSACMHAWVYSFKMPSLLVFNLRCRPSFLQGKRAQVAMHHG